jgi:hypothetical protein
MFLVMFYGVFSDVHLVYMWCSIVYFRMSEKYPCDVLLNFSLLRVFIFSLGFALDIIILFMLCIYLFLCIL